MGTCGGISIEQENLFDEVGHGLERPNEVIIKAFVFTTWRTYFCVQNNMLCPAMSMLLIPEKPGVKILPFHLAENQLEPLIEEIKKVPPQFSLTFVHFSYSGCILPGE